MRAHGGRDRPGSVPVRVRASVCHKRCLCVACESIIIIVTDLSSVVIVGTYESKETWVLFQSVTG